MTTYSTSEARDHFSEIINLVAYGKERQILNRRGKDIVAIIPIEDLKLLEKMEDQLDLEEARLQSKHAKKFGTKSWNEIQGEVGL